MQASGGVSDCGAEETGVTVGSLFAGIGGFDLGFERAGFAIKWQVEIDPFCRAVLAKHWPDVRRYEDVRTVGAELERVDVLCGGFPCQDISVAGRGEGIDGARSGLWSEYARLIRELRPRYVVVENVPALLGRGMDRVLGDLAARGYDAEWDCLPASAFGAHHQRDRVWIVAYPHGAGSQERFVFTGLPAIARCDDDGQDSTLGAGWAAEPDVLRVVHGLPGRVDRIRSLGNSVVPQIAEWIAKQILEAEGLNP
jgi:DNA (cytosine-5)-methyltransferase 1